MLNQPELFTGKLDVFPVILIVKATGYRIMRYLYIRILKYVYDSKEVVKTPPLFLVFVFGTFYILRKILCTRFTMRCKIRRVKSHILFLG